MSLDTLYREQIMDHYKNPRNNGKLEECSFKITDTNPFCGDEIEMFVKMQDKKISGIKFTGKGCAISQAAASMLTEFIKDKTLEEVEALSREDVIEMLGIEIGAVRVKCAMLSLVALKNGINKYREEPR